MDRSRQRPPILICGMALATAAYGYTCETSPGLLIFTLLTTFVATLMPRSLPKTTRAIIWSFLIMALLGTAANIGQLLPSSETMINGIDAYALDRLVTFTFVVGLTALLFPPSRDTVTLTAISTITLLIITAERAREAGDSPRALWLAVVSLTLIVVAAHTEQICRHSSSTSPYHGTRSRLQRITLATIWLTATIALTPPTDKLATTLRKWLYGVAGFELPDKNHSNLSGNSLSLSAPSANWQAQIRILLEIEGPHEPGYLREAVYRTYGLRQWVGRSRVANLPEQLLQETDTTNIGWSEYRLNPDDSTATYETWSFRPTDNKTLTSFCLPGNSTTFTLPENLNPLVSHDGIVALEQAPHPPRYYSKTQSPPAAGTQFPTLSQAFPQPDPQDQKDYLTIPANIAPSLSNWVARCFTTNQNLSIGQTISTLTSYFHHNFTYLLETSYGTSGNDPIIEFMEQRQGHCTLFATAATLMLRQQNIPTRMVSGYFCSELHPYSRRWVVRQRDAHAWCEAWNKDTRQWSLVEATPPGGMPLSHKPPSPLRAITEWVISSCRTLTEKIDPARPLFAISTLLSTIFTYIWSIIRTTIGIIIVTLATLIYLLYRLTSPKKPPESPSQKIRRQLTTHMNKIVRHHLPPHLHRLPHEAWTPWLQRIKPSLPPDQATHLATLLEEYQTLRYQPQPDPLKTKKWLHLSF